jgi:hypothetical protein
MDKYSWLLVLMLGFLAGFSERLVPELLDTALSKTRPVPATPAPGTAPAPGQAIGAGARSSTPPAAPTDLAAQTRALEIWTRRGGQGAVTDYLPEAKRELGLPA